MVAGVLLCIVGALLVLVGYGSGTTVVHLAVAAIGFVVMGLGAVCWQLGRIRAALTVKPAARD